MLELIKTVEKHFRLSILNSKDKKTYDLDSVEGRQDYLHRIYVELNRKAILSGHTLSLSKTDKIRRLFIMRYGRLE